MGLGIVYVTCSSRKEAGSIAKCLLDKNLVACANSFPLDSWYHWNNKLVNCREYALIAKTLPINYKKIVAAVKKIHSYKTPCILHLSAASDEDYLDWVRKELNQGMKRSKALTG
jgi:periplasmic divalent cation tolerance protein